MGKSLESVAKAICEHNTLRFIDFAGEGAFKETYRIEDVNGKPQALKVFRSVTSPQRTDREIEAMLRCNHKNIGKLLNVSTFNVLSNTYLFLIEEFFSGGTLTNRLQSSPVEITEVKRIGSQLIDAVEHIAVRGFVHRDIKPDNIMFRDDKQTPVIVDFGLVRDLNNTSLTHTWLMHGPGTPLYAAPEQLNNDKELIDWRTDQFALGILLGITAFGIHPYLGENNDPNEVVGNLMTRAPINKEFIVKCTETGLTPLIRMVSQWPVGRYRTSQELAKAWAEC
jgi:serine/threonine protein kinase